MASLADCAASTPCCASSRACAATWLVCDALSADSVTAVEKGETRSIHKLDFDALRARHPAVADILATALALRVRRLSELLVEAHYESADTRVRRRVAELAGDGGEVPLTQEELSNLAGTSRATVNRVLREAQAQGAVALRRGRIEVLDAARLRGR
jgi:CRP-like cAMP-binding protein